MAIITASTTQTDVKLILPVCAVALGLILFSLSAGHLLLRDWPGTVEVTKNAVMERKKGVTVLDRQIAYEALSANPSGRAQVSGGMMAYRAAEEAGLTSPDGLYWLQQAVNALERAVARAPANTEAWTWLAAARFGLEGPSGAAVQATDLSIQTGRHTTVSGPLQMAMANVLWARLSEASQLAVNETILKRWRVPGVRHHFAPIIFDNNGAYFVNRALEGDTVASAEFMAWFKEKTQRRLREVRQARKRRDQAPP